MGEKVTKQGWTGEPQASDSRSELTVLREIAEKATPGAWYRDAEGGISTHPTLWFADVIVDTEGQGGHDLDHDFIATFNPKRVLELLDRIETEETVLDILEEVLDYHSDVVTTHHEKCYLWHVGCLAVKLKRLLKGAG